MKFKHWSISLGLVSLIAIPVLGVTPVRAGLLEAGQNIVQAVFRPEVKLVLSADKKLVEVDAAGKEKVTWESLGDKATVMPKDVLKYTIASKNVGDADAKSLTLNQAIPDSMGYVLGSAESNNGAEITYKLKDDYKRPVGTKEFEADPQILVAVPQADGSVVEEVQAAPAEAYAEVRWQFSKTLTPEANLKASYEVVVN